MGASDVASLLAALIDDLDAMREHDARLVDFHARTRATTALRALAQTEACKRAASRQTVQATKMFLEHEIQKPRPPEYVGRDPALWEIVRDHLRARLETLPGR